MLEPPALTSLKALHKLLGAVQVELWMQRRHLPAHLKQSITSYYSEVWVRQEGEPPQTVPTILAVYLP